LTNKFLVVFTETGFSRFGDQQRVLRHVYKKNGDTKAFNYEGTPVSFKQENGALYVNATEMAKSFGKRSAEWLRLPSTIEFLAAFADVRKSHISDPVLVSKGNFQKESPKGTWLHEDVAGERGCTKMLLWNLPGA